MTPEHQRFIDNSDYERLLSKWRFAPTGDPLFQGDTGEYYAEVMARKRDEIGQAEAVLVSKRVGWN